MRTGAGHRFQNFLFSIFSIISKTQCPETLFSAETMELSERSVAKRAGAAKPALGPFAFVAPGHPSETPAVAPPTAAHAPSPHVGCAASNLVPKDQTFMSSPAQVAANQANAQLSSGPKTAEGKANSSRNALKTGLTGHAVLLPTEDAELYETHLLRHLDAFSPVGDVETALVQCLADTEWRLARIPSLEFGIFALARIEFADKFNDQPANLRSGLIQAHTYIAYHRQLNNLSIQESRLNRQLLKVTRDLAALQTERQQMERQKLTEAARQYLAAKKANQPYNPQEFGFEFSIEQIEPMAQLLEQREKAFANCVQ
jgi:hypothetical protein